MIIIHFEVTDLLYFLLENNWLPKDDSWVDGAWILHRELKVLPGTSENGLFFSNHHLDEVRILNLP